MRVLQINTEKTWRGGERQTLYTLLGLVEAGVNAELLCLKGYPMENAAKKAGIKTHSVARQSEAISF